MHGQVWKHLFYFIFDRKVLEKTYFLLLRKNFIVLKSGSFRKKEKATFVIFERKDFFWTCKIWNRKQTSFFEKGFRKEFFFFFFSFFLKKDLGKSFSFFFFLFLKKKDAIFLEEPENIWSFLKIHFVKILVLRRQKKSRF